MCSLFSWIFVDFTNNVWKFSQNNNKELFYTIMYRDGKWTQEKIIDKNVLSFSVCADKEGSIHIIYCNTSAQIKYCTLIENRWMGKTLYELKDKMLEMRNLKVNVIGNEMHIFYVIIENNGSDHGILMQCIWSGKETAINKIQDIVIASDLKDNYKIKADGNKNINMLFITDGRNEKSLNYIRYENEIWSPAKRLYSILGEEIDFEILNDQQGMHILNKFREDTEYYLEHVVLERTGNLKKLRIHESKNEISEPVIIKVNNQLYSCWLEENNILYSFFNGEVWSTPISYIKYDDIKLYKYNYCDAENKEEDINQIEIYGTDDLDFKFYIPMQFVINNNESSEALNFVENKSEQKHNNAYVLDRFEEGKEERDINMELSRLRLENNSLEKTITFLNMQLKQKQRLIDDYEMQISKLVEQKQKVDENYNIFMELQQKLQKELEDANKQLLDEKNCCMELENKLKESEKEYNSLRRQISMLKEENSNLYEKLNIEKNQTIMDRLLKRKSL